MAPFSKKRKRPVVTRPQRDENACVFCERCDDDEERYGKFLRKDKTVGHHFCMLFASGLSQNGDDDDEGLLGFLEADIAKEQRRASKMLCNYCQLPGAAIGCCVKSCKTTFHLPCGLENKALMQYFDSFNAYCYEHRPAVPRRSETLETESADCPICFCEVEEEPWTEATRAPCCTKAWYHRQCIQSQARTAGLHFFRCPLCNEQETFQRTMLEYGIYIPDQDAAWETEPDAFVELLERYSNCDAGSCLCPKGRKYDKPEKGWNLLVCSTCSSVGAHARCVGLRTRNPDHAWTCPDCRKVVGPARPKVSVAVNGKERRLPVLPHYPTKRGTKRKSAWARGRINRASKRLRLSPWKIAGTVSLKGDRALCGASPKSSIYCTSHCRENEHRPRMPKLKLERLKIKIDDIQTDSGESSESSNSVKVDLISEKKIVEKKVAMLKEYLKKEESKEILVSECSGDDRTGSSSPDSEARRVAMQFCIVEKNEKVMTINSSSEDDVAIKLVDNSSFKKRPRPLTRKPRRSKEDLTQCHRSIMSYFTPVKKESPPSQKVEEETKRPVRPIMSVKPTMKDSTEQQAENRWKIQVNAPPVKFRTPVKKVTPSFDINQKEGNSSEECQQKMAESVQESPAKSKSIVKSPACLSPIPSTSKGIVGSPKTFAKIDDYALRMSDSDGSEVEIESVSYEEYLQRVAATPCDEPRQAQPTHGRYSVFASSSDTTSETLTSEEDDDIILVEPVASRQKLTTESDFVPFDLDKHRKLESLLRSETDSDASSPASRSGGLFDLQNLPVNSLSNSEDDLFDMKAVPGFRRPQSLTSSSVSDQENSEPTSAANTGRRKKRLRLKRKRADLIKTINISSSSSSTESLTSFPGQDKRPIGIVQPSCSTNRR